VTGDCALRKDTVRLRARVFAFVLLDNQASPMM
jgi:hypothetical protein